MENVEKSSLHTRNVGVLLPAKDLRVKRFRQDAENGKARRNTMPMATRIASQGVLGASEALQSETDCTRQDDDTGFLCVKRIFRDWEEDKSTIRIQAKATEWAFDRIQASFREGERRMRQEIMIRSTDYLRRTHRASRRSKEALRCHTCARAL